MNILIITKYPWNDETAFGNTFNDIFKELPDVNIINIACCLGLPKTQTKIICFKIDEYKVIKSIFFRRISTGSIISAGGTVNIKYDINKSKESKLSHIRNYKWQLLYWVQEVVWLLGKWKTKELLEFLNENKIDIIFQPLYSSFYINRISRYIKKIIGKPMLLYSSDDAYGFKQFNLSPLFWIDRFLKRITIKKTTKCCDIVYVISSFLKKEYDKAFNCNCKILTKSSKFEPQTIGKKEYSNTLRMVYTGNISIGRWRTLIMLGEALDITNADLCRAELQIYTTTPITKKMRERFLSCKSIQFMGSIPFSEVEKVQEAADILVHAESFALKDKLQVRMSFSTKIIDYLTRKRCILAVGPSDIASIDYFIKNDAAVVIDNPKDFVSRLRKIIDNHALLDEFSEKAWKCGVKNHSKAIIETMLINDFKNLILNNR